jgi:hypothetical protein
MYIITADAFAGNKNPDPNSVLYRYEKALNYENQGVVKSSIQNIIKLKTVYPELKYSKVIKKMEELSVKSDSKTIRFTAYMAVNFLKYPEQLEWNLPQSYEKLDTFLTNCEINFDKPIAQTN